MANGLGQDGFHRGSTVSREEKGLVWLFNHYAEEPSTGGGLRHYRIAQELQKMGWKVVIFAASTVHQTDIDLIEDDSPYCEKIIGGIKFVFIKARKYQGNGKARILNILDYTRGCRKYAQLFGVPSIILSSSVHPLAWHLGRRFSRKFEVPWVCEVRDLWPESLIELGVISRDSLISKAIRRYEHHAYKTCDSLVFTMPGGIDYVEEQGWLADVKPEKVFWISNGIDVSRFDAEAVDWVHHDEDFEDESYFRLLFCGSVGEADALDSWLDAMKEVRARGYDRIRFFVYGDGPERNALMRRCEDEGIEGVFFKGRVQKRYVPSLVTRSDANILSFPWSRLLQYGCSFNKLFDYLTAGRPILSNVLFGRCVIDERQCGMSLEVQDGSLADLIISLFETPEEERRQMGLRAREASGDYDYSKLAKTMEEAFEAAFAARA